MNKTLQDFARKELKAGLAKLPEGNVKMFKRMYSHENLELPIDEVVDNMNEERLDWALVQVQNSLKEKAPNE